MPTATRSFSAALLDDTQQRLLFKIATHLFPAGGDAKLAPRMDDTEQRLTRKIVILLGGDGRADDTQQRLLHKWCLQLFVSGSDPAFHPRFNDTQQRLAWKICSLLFVSGDSLRPRMDDTYQRLLWKIATIYQSASPTPPTPQPPQKAVTPSPLNGSTGVAITGVVLSWSNGGGATGYDVWFNGALVAANFPGTSYPVPGLSNLTVYSWRIDSVNANGTTTGDTWSFQTVAAPQFSYSPASATINWTDVNGPQSGDLAFFNANADVATVTVINMQSTGISSITGLSTLPNLANLNVALNGLTALDVTGNPLLTILDAGVQSIAALDLSNNPLLTYINVQSNSLTTITGLSTCTSLVTLNCSNNQLASLDLTGLTALQTLDCSFNSGLTSLLGTASLVSLTALDAGSCDITGALNLSSLPTVIDHVSLDQNAHLTSVNLSSLVTINGGFGIGLSSCTALTSISVPNLDYNTGSFNASFCPSLLSLSLPRLTGMDGDLYFYSSGVVTASFPLCTHVHDLSGSNCLALTAFTMPNLDSNYGGVFFNGCASLTSLTLNTLLQNSDFIIFGCTSLVSLSLNNPMLALAGYLDAHGCTNLVNVVFTATSNLPTPINFNGCGMNVASVDGILAACNAAGQTVNTIDLSGGTNATPTGGLANADYLALLAAGNTVTIN